MAKHVFLFGAGASHDVVDDQTHNVKLQFKPPLTNSLFNKEWDFIMKEYPRLSELMPDIRARLGAQGNLEEVLSQFALEMDDMTSANADERRLQLIDTERYLNDLFTQVSHKYLIDKNANNYVTLLRKLKEANIEKGMLITFNYDLLLDQALEYKFGYKFEHYADYTRQPMKYFKVHGSVNWHYPVGLQDMWGDIETDPTKAMLRYRRSKDFLNAYPTVLRQNIPYREYVSRMPELAIPMPQAKDPFFKRYANDIHNELQEAEKVTIIGWSAGDTEYTKLLDSSIPDGQAELVYVGKSSIKDCIKRISPNKGVAKWKNVVRCSTGFSGLFSDNGALRTIFSFL